MNILITGANGSLGREIIEVLKDNNILFLVDYKFHEKDNTDNINYIESDIRDFNESLLKESIDVIIHLAAKVHVLPKNEKDIKDFYDINLGATKKLYNYAIEKNVKHFVFISTLSVYGSSTIGKVNEKSLCNPQTPYADSKYKAEKIGLSLFDSEKLPITIFRSATMYGNGDRGNYGKLISSVRSGILPLIENGKAMKPVVYVKDVAEIVKKSLLQNDLFGQIYIISENNYSYKNIVDTISSVYNVKARIVKIPLFIIYILNCMFKNIGIINKLNTLSSNFEVDNSKLVNTLNYIYLYNFKKGLEDSKSYYRNIGDNDSKE